MSKKHHNYTNYSKPQQTAPVVESEVKVEEVAPVIEETVVTPEPEVKEVLGVVAGCEKLNVRTAPNTDANIATVLAAGTEVMIDEAESTADFYKIVTGAGVEGFCMKKFIKIA